MKNQNLKQRIDGLLAEGDWPVAARQLQALLKREPGSVAAHEKLGVAFLRMANPAAAKRHFSQALQLAPQSRNALDGLAEAAGALGDMSLCRRAGARVLAMRDQLASEVRSHALLRGPREGCARRLIAYSLYGAAPRYCETAVLNVAAARTHFPGWQCRFYHDGSVPDGVLARLREAGAELVDVDADPQLRPLPGTMWRFAALDDTETDVVIVRDADALLGPRDRQSVDTWLASGLPFHVIRDYWSHTELILAGLFGMRGGLLDPIVPHMPAYLASAGPLHRWTDQAFLRHWIWPAVREVTLTHDLFFGFGSTLAVPLPMWQRPEDHIGADVGSCRIVEARIDVPDGTPVRWELSDGAGARICAYEALARQGAVRVGLPLPYAEAVRAGRYHFHCHPVAS